MHGISRNQLKPRPCKIPSTRPTCKHTPAWLFSTNDITFDWSAALWLVKRNFVVPSYPCMPMLRKKVETKMIYALDLQKPFIADSYISFTLKLESWQNFCSNMLISSSTYGKENIFDFPPCRKMVVIFFTAWTWPNYI